MPSTAPKIYRLPVKKPARALHATGRVQLHFRYTDPITKKKCRKVVYGKTEAEAKKKKDAFLRDVAKGLRMAEQGKTVGQWAEDWLAIYKKPKVSARTYVNYEIEVTRIKNQIGYKPLSSIIQADIVGLLNTRMGKSKSAIRHTWLVVNSIFETAVNNRLIAYNPCTGVELPDGPVGTHRALEPWEIKIIEKVAKTHRLGPGIMLMLWGGLRKGEACAFTSDCVQGKELGVAQSIEWISNQPGIKAPKSVAGIRSVPVFPKLKPYLKRDGYYITTSDGKGPVSAIAFKRAFESFLVKCSEMHNGCTKRHQPKGHVWKPFSFQTHDLRHTWFTMLYNSGVDVKVASLWGGHSDINVTMKVYQHIKDDRLKSEAKKVALKTGGSKGGSKHKTYTIKRL